MHPERSRRTGPRPNHKREFSQDLAGASMRRARFAVATPRGKPHDLLTLKRWLYAVPAEVGGCTRHSALRFRRIPWMTRPRTKAATNTAVAAPGGRSNASARTSAPASEDRIISAHSKSG